MIKALFKWNPVLSNRQYTVLIWWMTEEYGDKDGIVCDGSVRSGKTISMGFSFVLWAMTMFEGQDFALCGKTVGSLKRNVINNLKKQIEQRGFRWDYRRTENLVVISKNGRSNNFFLFGGKDESSQDLIQGMTLAGIFFDEVALMPESFVNQGTARCSVEGSKYWFNCNPSAPMHWFKVNWINQHREKNLLYIHFTMEDNPSLSKSIRDRYARQYTGVFYKRYILGLWAMADGIVYDSFNPDVHVLKEYDTEGECYVSSDFGIQNATVFLLWRKLKESNAWCCVREYYYSGREQSRQKTVSELTDGLETMLDGLVPRQIIIDPSASALILECRKRGYKVKSAINDVLDGITDVSTMIGSNKLFFDESCKHTLAEFGLYSWDTKASERGEDKPVKEHDHCMDAVRYFVKTMRLVKRDGHQQHQQGHSFFI